MAYKKLTESWDSPDDRHYGGTDAQHVCFPAKRAASAECTISATA